MSTVYGPENDFNPRPWLPNAPYYSAADIDIRDVIEAFELNFNLGYVVSRIVRQKPGNSKLMDLKKARIHLDREIARLENPVATAIAEMPGDEAGTFITSPEHRAAIAANVADRARAPYEEPQHKYRERF